jgi:hypothetical protein
MELDKLDKVAFKCVSTLLETAGIFLLLADEGDTKLIIDDVDDYLDLWRGGWWLCRDGD